VAERIDTLEAELAELEQAAALCIVGDCRQWRRGSTSYSFRYVSSLICGDRHMSKISREDFGRYADRVEDFGGELILPINGNIEIHPGNTGDWCVVASGREVLCRFADIEDAVTYAEAKDSSDMRD